MPGTADLVAAAEGLQASKPNGARAIIAGCTEIPLVLKDEMVNVPLVSSTDALALRTVRLARGDEALPQSR